MKKEIHLILLSFLIFSCEGEKQKTEIKKEEVAVKLSGEVEKIAKRHIEAELSIPASEKYSFHIYKENLDGDSEMDAIITVNRLDYAMNKAAMENKTAKRAELGFMGNYNYIFYYDGKLKQISAPVILPSSPKAELKVSFENVFSSKHKDILVDFRVLNASYKDIYTVSDHNPKRIFQWKNFDGLKSVISEAYYFEYVSGSIGLEKDIVVKKATLIQPQGEIDIFTYEPELVKTNEIVHQFFFHPESKKYMTMKK